MWHYNAKKFKEASGDVYYGIVEAYPELPSIEGDVIPHTKNEVTIIGSSPEDLVSWLKTVIKDIETYPPIED